MQMVRITNKTARLLVLPNARVAGREIEGRRLAPGGNNVEAGYWNAVLARTDRPGEIVRTMIDRGEISEDKNPKAAAKPEGPEKPKTIGDMKLPAALALVETETEADVLAAWNAREKRKQVREAIAARLAALGGGNETDETETDENE